MSITNIMWPRRRPVIDEQEPRPWKLPPDLEQQLERAMDDYSETEAAPPKPTAQQLADAIARLNQELGNARQIVADSEARVTELETQLAKRLDEEIAELELLRPKGDAHANADADPCHAGDAGPDHNAGSGEAGLPDDASAGPQGVSGAGPQISADQ
jgi:uncharacterized membrane protein YccC